MQSITCTERIGRIEVEGKAVRNLHCRRNLGTVAERRIQLITANIRMHKYPVVEKLPVQILLILVNVVTET